MKYVKKNCKVRTLSECNKIYNFNENVFDDLSPESFYWIGAIACSGVTDIVSQFLRVIFNNLSIFVSLTNRSTYQHLSLASNLSPTTKSLAFFCEPSNILTLVFSSMHFQSFLQPTIVEKRF